MQKSKLMNKNIRQSVKKVLKETYINSEKKQNQLINYVLEHTSEQPKTEPISKVLWVPIDRVYPNLYNPNKMATPEKRLLLRSMVEQGITLPLIVTHNKEKDYTLIDGFHRWSIIKKSKELRKRLNYKVPVVVLDIPDSEQIITSIRHNRARGIHQIECISEVVKILSEKGWSSSKIMEALGMDADEVLRLKQFKGLGELYKDEEYSSSWS